MNDKEILFKISLLISKSLSGNITKGEQAELDSWREENEYNQRLFEQICSETTMREKFDQYKHSNVQTAFDAFVKKREELHSRRRWIGTLSRYAAIIIVPVLVVVFYYSKKETVKVTERSQFASELATIQRNLPVLTLSNGKEMVLYNQELLLEEENGVRISVNEEGRMQYDKADSVGAEMVYNTLTTPSQCDFMFILADGTRVWMNAKSSLRYPVAFHGKERVVYAEGEIYLEVARDEKHPFFVMLNGMKVEVLGTSFNVNSYADEDYAEVTLVEGRVAAHVDDKSYDLLPSRQLRWDKKNESVDIRIVNVDDYIAWKRGQYVFKGRSLEEVAKVLERWYDMEIIFEDEKSKKTVYTGVINKEENFDAFVLRLRETSSLSCRMESNRLYIK
ncbi:MAG TPA: FecR domain-containing protein [Butyricimonas virosa]|uniref:FecR domain-containing protein n=1 Tax=Butyricimonas virosa TaxID=544645 RepID=A0A921L078_9BACT|nr:FecR domain-containing protein [Butyricimonas virosa]